MTTSVPAANVRSDPSYRTVSTGGAGGLTRTNCIGSDPDCRTSRQGGSQPRGRPFSESFGGNSLANPLGMHDTDRVFPDDVPIADAVEQQQSTADLSTDDGREMAVPLEATTSDWQEQRETVLIDPELEEPEQRGCRANMVRH